VTFRLDQARGGFAFRDSATVRGNAYRHALGYAGARGGGATRGAPAFNRVQTVRNAPSRSGLEGARWVKGRARAVVAEIKKGSGRGGGRARAGRSTNSTRRGRRAVGVATGTDGNNYGDQPPSGISKTGLVPLSEPASAASSTRIPWAEGGGQGTDGRCVVGKRAERRVRGSSHG